MKVINNNPQGYAELRNINLFEEDSVLFVDDVFSFGNKLKHKLTGNGYNIFYKGLFYSFFNRNTPCHFFNSINLGKNSWMVTFETTLPRIGDANKFWYSLAVKKLGQPNCKKLIALSECTYKRQVDYLAVEYPQYKQLIEQKIIVMHPPQALLIAQYEEKKLDDTEIVFTIVGSDFFRKGGREVLNVFNQLIPLFPQLKLNIVSSLIYGDYASKTTKSDYLKAVEIINKFPKNIRHYSSLPNNEVLELLKRSSVGLLPSWGDTYGYSVLESQAAGCPVITTNLRAFPEINNNAIGWLLDVPLNKRMDGDIDTVEKRIIFQESLENQLRETITEIANAPELIKIKGCLSLERIKKEHDPECYKSKLKKLYEDFFLNKNV